MWCIALLVNTSKWKEMMENWKIICLVFLQLHSNDENGNEQQHYAELLDRIRKIQADPNISTFIQSTTPEPNSSSLHDTFDFDDGDDNNEYDNESPTATPSNTRSQHKKDQVSCLLTMIFFIYVSTK